MTGSVALDVVIGLVFIYLLYSLLASIIQEIVATTLSFRAKILEKAIARMLQDEQESDNALKSRVYTWLRLLVPFNWFSFLRKGKLSESFYNHQLIKYLAQDKWHSKPSYLSSGNFSKVIIDLLRGEDLKAGEDMRPKIEDSLYDSNTDENNNSEAQPVPIEANTKKYLRSLWVDAQGDVEEFKHLLETWFDDTMKRTSGWYKKYNQMILLFIGLGIAIIFNVDSILIVKKLSSDPEIRAQLVNQANNFIEAHPNLEQEHRLQKAAISQMKYDSATEVEEQDQAYEEYIASKAKLDTLINRADELIKNDIKNASGLLALGWSDKCDCGLTPNGKSTILMRIIGWLITALAISLGAPFWFDLLNKLMKLRAALKTEVSQTTVKERVSATNIKRVG